MARNIPSEGCCKSRACGHYRGAKEQRTAVTGMLGGAVPARCLPSFRELRRSISLCLQQKDRLIQSWPELCSPRPCHHQNTPPHGTFPDSPSCQSSLQRLITFLHSQPVAPSTLSQSVAGNNAMFQA